MRSKLPLIAALAVILATASSTAYAFDCIRVSSSRQGLMQSARSGNWLPFDFGSPAGVKQTFATVDIKLTDEQSACIAQKYAESQQPLYFALGTGVSGGKKESTTSNGARAEAQGFGVLAWNNRNTRVLSDGKGIDHIEASGVFDAIFAAASDCGVDLGGPEGA